MIQLNNVKKIYTTGEIHTEALGGVNIFIDGGEMLSVMGTSGSGKSTLLNIIGCMDHLTEGEYQYDDTVVNKLSIHNLHKFRKEHISFIFQHFALMHYYTVYENVEIPLRAKNVKKKERKRIIMEKLDILGIADLANRFPNNISGGQQQRCAIARALASGNDIILADEPTGALDRKTSDEIMDILCRINKEEGKTIIIVTHDEEISKYTNRIIQISDGKIIEDQAFKRNII